MRIIAPLIKLGLGGGAVYLLVDQNFFSDDQKETIKASNKIIDLISDVPVAGPILERVPKLASKEELKQYWNAGVKITFNYLAALPETSKDACYRGFSYLKEELQKQMKAPQK